MGSRREDRQHQSGVGTTSGTSSAEDARFMEAALAAAREAGERGEVPVGAVVVMDGTVIARGLNAAAHPDLAASLRLEQSVGADFREGVQSFLEKRKPNWPSNR